MAVEIITKNGSSYQEAMNLLAACYAWNNVVYDTETTTNVTQLWASEKVYLDFTDGKIYVKHIDGYVVTPTSLSTVNYIIYKTDLGVGFVQVNGNTKCPLFIGKTIASNGVESAGIVTYYNASYMSNFIMFTDNMTNTNNSSVIKAADFCKVSRLNTQLVPVYSNDGDEHFPDLFWCFMRTNTADEKIQIGDEKYLATQYLAIRYTE